MVGQKSAGREGGRRYPDMTSLKAGGARGPWSRPRRAAPSAGTSPAPNMPSVAEKLEEPAGPEQQKSYFMWLLGITVATGGGGGGGH